MAATRQSGKPNLTGDYIKKASTAIARNSVVSLDTNGFLVPAAAATTNVKGIAQEAIASTDSDYATARNTTIDVPLPGDLFLMDCNTTITQAMVGDFFDLADANVVDNSDALGAVDVVELVRIEKATYTSAANPSVGVFRFNPVVLLETHTA
jgi:hypothetical protein